MTGDNARKFRQSFDQATQAQAGQRNQYYDGITIYPSQVIGRIDHGGLRGLTDDDHTQYLKKAGDTMTGTLAMGSNKVTSSYAPVDSVDLTNKGYVDTAVAAAAPASGSYWTATSEAGLSGETNLGALTTGLLKHTVAAGTSTPATATAGVDYSAPGHTHTLADITDDGTMAAQNANSVAITGGSITGITDLAVADGGTGASTATAAFDNLAPTTTLGDTIYHNGTDNVRLAGNATTTKRFLTQTGTGATSAAPAWSNLASSDMPSGVLVQRVVASTSAVATGTTTIPADDTMPQNTEGTEFITATITPKATANRLRILFTGPCANNTAGRAIIAALFQDTSANALAAAHTSVAASNDSQMLSLQHEMAAGTTSATTFKIRIGPNSAATITLNGVAGGRLWGGVAATFLVIEEVAA